MKLHECLVCREQVNDYPDDTCRRCRKDVAERSRIQWEPSKTAHDRWRDAQTAAEFRLPDYEAVAARQSTG